MEKFSRSSLPVGVAIISDFWTLSIFDTATMRQQQNREVGTALVQRQNNETQSQLPPVLRYLLFTRLFMTQKEKRGRITYDRIRLWQIEN